MFIADSGTPVVQRTAPDRRLLDGKCDPEFGDASPTRQHSSPHRVSHQHHTVIGYDGLRRLAIMVTPESDGDFEAQAREAVATIQEILGQQREPMALTTQTVFVDDAANVPVIQRLLDSCYGDEMPLTLYVIQPPCDARGLAIEAWAISTATAEVEFISPHLITVRHDGLRWIHASAGSLALGDRSAYQQSTDAFEAMKTHLAEAGASFTDVARVWLYQGGITQLEGDTERYRELNRARTDFFDRNPFTTRPLAPNCRQVIYPASTGIGTLGRGLMTTCLALQTNRTDVRMLALENPLQTSAYSYPKDYSVKSPKFSRAMAMRIGNHITTWISGTASIVNSETVHLGDAAMQTEQTITNIEKLIDAANFHRLGWKDAGATVDDLAKVRVYVKHASDYAACRAVCERRFGRVPAIYALADVCRPDLLVEIEGVAFSPVREPAAPA